MNNLLVFANFKGGIAKSSLNNQIVGIWLYTFSLLSSVICFCSGNAVNSICLTTAIGVFVSFNLIM